MAGIVTIDVSYQIPEVQIGFGSNFMGRIGTACRSAVDVCLPAV